VKPGGGGPDAHGEAYDHDLGGRVALLLALAPWLAHYQDEDVVEGMGVDGHGQAAQLE
jgi:hypothetical protein